MDNQNPGKPQILLVIAYIGVILVILFWPTFVQGKVIVPGDIPTRTDLFWGNDVNHSARPQNPLLSDQINQFYIFHTVLAESFQNGEGLALWNPYIFTGQPLVANAQSAAFYPPNMLLTLLSAGRVATIRGFFNLFIAGLFTYLFCRRLTISHQGALLAAVAFMLSGPLIVWLGHPHANVLASLPLLMWATESLIRGTRSLLWSVVLGLGVSLSILGGHPETTFHVMFVVSVYFGLRVIFTPMNARAKVWLFIAFTLAVVLGSLIAGVQLIPFVDFVLQSSTLASGGRSMGGENLFFSPDWLPNLATSITFIYPNFFGNPPDYNYFWPFQIFQNYNEQSIYFGLVPLALAVGAIFASPKRRSFIIIAFLALFCISVAWRLPGFEIVNHSPIFSMMLNKRLKMPFVFFAATMAGFGFDLVLHSIRSRQRFTRQTIATILILALTLVIFGLIGALKYSPMAAQFAPESFRFHLLFSIFSFHQIRTIIPLITLFGVLISYLIFARREGFERIFGYALILLTLVELMVIGWGYSPMMNEDEILPPSETIELLKARESQPFRLTTTNGIFWPNYGAKYGVSDVAGYDLPVYQRYADLYRNQGGKTDYRQQWHPDWPLIDFLNVKYIISPATLDPAKFSLISQTDQYGVYENHDVMPRANMIFDVEWIADPDTILDRIIAQKVDLGESVILEEPLPPSQVTALGPASDFSIEFLKYASNQVILEVSTEEAGLLVMSDLFAPGWRAKIDGERVDIHRANYAYRALFVPAGEHLIAFRYSPAAFRWGTALTVLGLIIALAGLVVASVRKDPQSD